MSYNWQQKGWPKATCNRAALRDELKAFEAAFLRVKNALKTELDDKTIAVAMTDEAVKTSEIEGVRVDETVVMSSICRALGMPTIPIGFTRDVRAEGVAQMVLAVKRDWNMSISSALLTDWHAALLANDDRGLRVGAFRQHPVQVVRRDAYGEIEVVFEAPPSERVPREIAAYCRKWSGLKAKPMDIALKAAMLHPHFESIHPFEDGNGRIGRALVAKVLAEGLGVGVVLPISTVIMRHRKDYYDEIHSASQSLDWTNWARFFIPVLSETLTDFLTAAQFVADKGEYLARYESRISERAKKVIVRMFRDGPHGVAAGLSAAKWTRMTKVSKPTATRDLEELVKVGAIVREGESVATHYRLNFDFREPIELMNEPLEGLNEPLNEPLFEVINEAIKKAPGINKPKLVRIAGKSKATVERAIAALVKAGRIEHRGSKKTGGYWIVKSE